MIAGLARLTAKLARGSICRSLLFLFGLETCIAYHYVVSKFLDATVLEGLGGGFGGGDGGSPFDILMVGVVSTLRFG